eukprot:GILI01001958.1.p1 GENE.GILI01001958.1~~GILI01001958.1.p1  ORF type:complete len:479 (-),score=94.18 GILI01001958.1:101-1537(-)
MASQGAMAMAVARVAKCIGQDEREGSEGSDESEDDDNEIQLGAPLPMFVHPLAFPLGSDPYRYFYGAVLGNILLVPTILFVVLQWPIAYALQRWGLPDEPPIRMVRTFLGLPHVLVLPYAALTESITVVAAVLLSGGDVEGSGRALPSIAGMISVAVLVGIAAVWAYAILLKLMPIRPVREKSEYEGILWWLFKPWYEWVPPHKKADDDGPGDEDDPLLVDPSQANVAGSTAREEEDDDDTSPTSKTAADRAAAFETLDTWGLLLGDKAFLWADYFCYLLAAVAGIVEGAGDALDMDCRTSVAVMFALAVSQALLAITTMVPAEFIVHALMAAAVGLLSTATLIEAIQNDPDAVLNDDQQALIGLLCNALAFFGTAVGVIRAIVRIVSVNLRAKAQHLLRLMRRQRLGGWDQGDTEMSLMPSNGDRDGGGKNSRLLSHQFGSANVDLLDLFLSGIKEEVEVAQSRRVAGSPLMPTDSF